MGVTVTTAAREPRTVRRPVLLLLVYGAVLITVGITATSQAGIVSSHYTRAALEAVVGSDTAAVRGFVNTDLRANDLAALPGAARTAQIESALADLVSTDGIVHAEIRLPDGTVLASEAPGLSGRVVDPDDAFTTATLGHGGAALQPVDEARQASAAELPLAAGSTVLRVTLPIRLDDDSVPAVILLWRDAAPILAQLDAVRREIVVLTLTAALIVALLLTFIFRAAQRRLTRQTEQLIGAMRLDPLTGLLNHGALVTTLVERIETARLTGAPLAIAIVDIDNFRALNDTHGHEAGDEALLEVAESLETLRRPGWVLGRYGPDEFLAIAPAADAAGLADAIESLRTALETVEIVVPGAERLPLTISAGLARFPTHGESATSLLSIAATALGAARTGGGNAIRVADTDPEANVTSATFDVFQGLVLAINTKDRYTKRHSEDVARYAIFIARQLGLDEAFIETLRVAGLLHDVGKIGIPDPILRKPGRLTSDEFAILKQHVALGDSIVRDLPDIDLVRAGIRHHHERWDGKGYLDRLDGEAIPLIARILAVGDTFSAMTTSRPYRKALGTSVALRRLADAAGSQLDESLVRTFLTGMETAPDAPIPGEAPVALLWTPAARIA